MLIETELSRQFKCCGAVSERDWQYSQWQKRNPGLPNKVPDSCCRTESKRCGTTDHPSNIYTDVSTNPSITMISGTLHIRLKREFFQGCIDKLGMHLRMHLVVLGAVGLGMSIVQVRITCILSNFITYYICIMNNTRNFQIFGMIFSCCLYIRLRKKEDHGYYGHLGNRT